MKKSKVLITAIVGGAILLAGCTNNLSPASVSKNLTHNLNVLSSTVKNLDTINNSYLSNPDIYPISNNTIKASNMALSNIVPVRTETRKIATLSLDNESTNLDNINKENTELTNNNTTNIFYYDVKPIKYNPRYLQDISALENGDYLSNYISKVKTLYAITSDVIEASDALSDCKNYVLNYVVEIKDLNKEIENGTFEPSNQQISALNNYIGDIKTTIKRIKRCNGELSNEVNNINKTDSTGITTGIDVVKSNYLKVLNHLDTRITYLKNALTTLEQIKGILQEAQNIIETPELENNNTNIKDLNIPNNNLEENNSFEDNVNLEKNVNSEENVDLDNNNIQNNLDNTNNQDNSNDIIENKTNKDKLNNFEDITPDNTNEESLNKPENQEESSAINNEDLTNSEQESTNSTIDTYESTINNLDTYKPEIKEDINNVENTETIENNEENINNSTQNNVVSDNNLNNNEIVNNDVSNNNIVNNGTANNGNMLGYGTEEDKINAPNGMFQNGIITQNNLNNGVNNGVNGFGTGNGTNYENLNNSYNNNSNRTNKNVDTYGYNTIIDMINHGTVNNGINTLSVESSTKPSMVNSDEVTLPDDSEYKVELLSEEE